MRKESFMVSEYYHIYNRGVDKRKVFMGEKDFDRFVQSINEFNSVEPIGSLVENLFRKKTLGRETSKSGKLVEIVAYRLLENHYHFILKEIRKGGISEFMKRLGGGYTKYFNEKYKRSGVLFQGVFKSSHIRFDGRLLELSAYVNLNHKVHGLGRFTSKWGSWAEYMGEVKKEDQICNKKEINKILRNFKNKKEYGKFAENTVKRIVRERKEDKELSKILID
jgi:putative transposase